MESGSTTEIPTPSGEKKQVRLVDMPVTSQQEALQLMVTFINLAQKRGSFTLDESRVKRTGSPGIPPTIRKTLHAGAGEIGDDIGLFIALDDVELPIRVV